VKQEQLAKLLGRPLTATESANYDLYLEIATGRLEDLLCFSLSCNQSQRVFESREAYATVFTDPFSSLSRVSVDGTEVDSSTYSKRLFDRRSATWYNSIVFDDRFSDAKEITIDASWGFNKMPADLQLILARCFALVSTEQSNGGGKVLEKQVEDYRVKYSGASDTENFISTNEATINKYSLCGVGEISNGRVCRLYYI
jgi:hypothetical protein